MADIKEYFNKMNKEEFIIYANTILEECPTEVNIEYEHPGCDGGDTSEICKECWENALLNVEFKPYSKDLVPAEAREVLVQVKQAEIDYKKMGEDRDVLKAKLKNLMEQYGVKKWENDGFTVTYNKQSIRTSVDAKKLLLEYPEIYSEVIKQSVVKPSVSFRTK